MGSAAAASIVTFITALLGVCAIVLLMLRYYLPLRSTPVFLTIPVFLALFLPMVLIILVPIDLASNAVTKEGGTARGIRLNKLSMLVMWRIAYWLTFILTWLILPLLGDYVDSGFRDSRSRFRDSLKSNLRYQLIVLALATVLFIYWIMQVGFDRHTIKGTVIAMAYAWGLILAIYLMGHGLVSIPRELCCYAYPTSRLRRLQVQAPRAHERMVVAIEELHGLEQQVSQIRSRKVGIAKTHIEWIEELATVAISPDARSTPLSDSRAPTVITEKYLAELSRKLKRAQHKRLRFVEEWAYIVHGASFYQAIIDASSSKRVAADLMQTSTWSFQQSRLSPYLRYRLHATLLPALRLSCGVMLAAASVSIMWSEVFKAFPRLSVVGRSCVHHPSATERGKIGLAGQIMAAAWLSYMCIAAISSIREVKVWGNRALVRRHTYAESATWYATQVAKLTLPLAWNFTTFLPRDIYEQTAFHHFFGKLINLTPLGGAFSQFFPMLILVPVLATISGLYGRVKRFASCGMIEDDDEAFASSLGGWREGHALLEQARLDHRREPHFHDETGEYGLSSRDSSPLGRARPAPYSDIDEPAGPSPRQIQRQARGETRTGQSGPSEIEPGEASEDTGFFDNFTHRLRNTLDTVDTPQIKFKLSKPKWLKDVSGR